MSTDTSASTTHPASRRPTRFAAAVTAVAIGLLAPLLATASPASAATANAGVYVVTPRWWGHCSAPTDGVAGIATVNSYVGHSNRGDYGDDITWVPVRLNTNQSVQIKVICRRLGAAGGASMSINIRPTRHGQTYFVGPDSSYWVK